ncbi:interferon-induced protein 44-like [Pholidichthys leucotaenia]
MGFFYSKPAPQQTLLDEGWRNPQWSVNLQFVNDYRPPNKAQVLRILLHGPVGAGKSSYINSVKTVLQGGGVCRQVPVQNGQSSHTREYQTYMIRKSTNPDRFYSVVLSDMNGLCNTSRRARRVHVKDVKRLMKGHIRDGYVFNPECHISKEDRLYNRDPADNDKVHVLVSVLDSNTVSMTKNNTVEAILDVREEAFELGIPHVAIFTKIDQACPAIKNDLKNVYKSVVLKEKIEQLSARVGIPINQIFPVKNYHSETEQNNDMDALLLSSLENIINIGNEQLNPRQ